jgi:hypothetical protein
MMGRPAILIFELSNQLKPRFYKGNETRRLKKAHYNPSQFRRSIKSIPYPSCPSPLVLAQVLYLILFFGYLDSISILLRMIAVCIGCRNDLFLSNQVLVTRGRVQQTQFQDVRGLQENELATSN